MKQTVSLYCTYNTRSFIEMARRDVSIQAYPVYENLSLEDLRRCCFIEDNTVQSAISRTIVDRTQRAFRDLMLLSDIFNGVPLFMLQSHVMFIFAAISSQARRGLMLVHENVCFPAPVPVRNRMSVDALIIVKKAMAVLKDAGIYLHRTKELQEFEDYLDLGLLCIEFEQAGWLSQVETLQQDCEDLSIL
ncbi:hypothetical protein M514_06148 [Trichuris suis]|uniref:Uncharacterized protein n=1 Tax=Trichuris suis TaxID=68888 RepID=A0A085M736_9BILA|nr:hypothetical protein M513_06148 [Trichuris suis]KFD69827.1 hypothetical protein M514_06148 [Trichuris suis]